MPRPVQTSSETTWLNYGARSIRELKLWSTRITQPHTQLDLETCADDGALSVPALTMANEDVRKQYEKGWKHPVPPRVSDGAAWYQLLLDTALKGKGIPTYVKVLNYPERNQQKIATFIESSRGDIIEVLSPQDAYPSKMLIETILLLY